MKLEKILILTMFIFILLFCFQSVSAESDENITEIDNVNDNLLLTEEVTDNLGEDKINIDFEPVVTEAEYQAGSFKFKITDKDTHSPVVNKTVRFTTHLTGMVIYNYDKDVVTDSEGIATYHLNQTTNQNFKSGNIPVGEYNYTIRGMGDLNGTTTQILKITPCDVVITTIPYAEDRFSDKKFTVIVKSKATGEPMKGVKLSLYVPRSTEKYYSIETDNNGISEFGVSSLNIGSNEATISTSDANLKAGSIKTVITINKVKIRLKVSSVTKYFNSGKTLIVKAYDVKTGKLTADVPIEFRVGKNKYTFKTKKDGSITFTTSLKVGKNTVKMTPIGNIFTGSTVTQTINVKKSPAKLKIVNSKVYFDTEPKLQIKLINTKNKKVIYNTKVKLRVKLQDNKYHTFYSPTQLNGVASFNIALGPGKFKFTAGCGDAKSYTAKTISSTLLVKKAPFKITKKVSGKNLKITAKNKISNKGVSKVKLTVKVYTGKKYKTFVKKTNSKGQISLNLKNIKSGKHSVVITALKDNYVKKTYRSSVKL